MMKLNEAIDYLQPIADNAELSGYSEAMAVALSAMRDAERQCKENAREINCAALETYGKEAQKSKLFEEIGELMDALCKCAAGRDKVTHLAEEIADVGIMMEQMAIMFDCEEEVERQRRYKLRRLEQRIEEANHGQH